MAVPMQTIANDRDLHFALVGQLPTPGFNKFTGIRIHGNYAFCTFMDPDSGSGGFIAIDVEDPANPKIGQYLSFADGPSDLAISGNVAFLVHGSPSSGDQPFSLVDISAPLNPTPLFGVHSG
jgi:hypothetical protein